MISSVSLRRQPWLVPCLLCGALVALWTPTILRSVPAAAADVTLPYKFNASAIPLDSFRFAIDFSQSVVMKFSSAAVPFLATLSAAVPALENSESRATGSLSSWLASESSVALQGVLNNIGSAGSKVPGAKQGVVVASPSTSDPDYYYTWTRDSALTFKCLVDQFLGGNAKLEPLIQDYITAQAQLQPIQNPSGGLCNGGLGEPKFQVDLTAFTGSWGRPQRDGPALRATALIAYSKYLISKGQTQAVKDVVWPVVSNDLSYVTQYWNATTFDLWEEVNSSSFFTTASQYRSLVEGSAMAAQLGTSCPHCDSQAPLLLCFLQSYWTGSYALSNTGGGRSGKDVNSILASIHIYDPEAKCDATTFQPCSDKALANHKAVTDSFRSIYKVNSGIAQGKGVAVGRYAEDVYQGGNPWYLATFAAAEQLYDAVYQWNKIGALSITSTSLAFFKDIYPAAAVGSYAAATPQFKDITAAALAYADSYMANAQRYTPADGSLAEQYGRGNGSAVSARDLTWSYAAFLTAFNARANIVPASWGAASARLPASCTRGSATGPCSAPSTTTWPGRSPTTTSAPCRTPSAIAVTFNEKKQTAYGESVLVLGSIPQLGSWDTSKAVELNANQYSAGNPLWSTSVRIPQGMSFEYKFLLRQTGGNLVYESDPNRHFKVDTGCSATATIDDTWR